MALLARLKALLHRERAAPLELTVEDQWVLKVLFEVGAPMTQEEIVASVQVERPVSQGEAVEAAVEKLHEAGFVSTDEGERYRLTRKAGRVRSLLPVRPGVNIDYYGG